MNEMLFCYIRGKYPYNETISNNGDEEKYAVQESQKIVVQWMRGRKSQPMVWNRTQVLRGHAANQTPLISTRSKTGENIDYMLSIHKKSKGERYTLI